MAKRNSCFVKDGVEDLEGKWILDWAKDSFSAGLITMIEYCAQIKGMLKENHF